MATSAWPPRSSLPRAEAEAAASGQGQITPADGQVALLLTKQRVDALQDDLYSAEETLSQLSSRRSRGRLACGLRELTAGRRHDNAAALAALARHPGRPDPEDTWSVRWQPSRWIRSPVGCPTPSLTPPTS